MVVEASKSNRRVMLCLEVEEKTKKAFIRSDFTEPEETEHPDALAAIEYLTELIARMVGVGLTGQDPSGARIAPAKRRRK
jgi:hypothetical protein